MMTLEKQIALFWATMFNVDEDQLNNTQTLFANEPVFDDVGQLVLYQLTTGSFIRTGDKIARALFGQTKLRLSGTYTDKDIETLFDFRGFNVSSHSTLYDYFVDHQQFTPLHHPSIFCKLLDLAYDEQAVFDLLNACSAEDLDEADMNKRKLDPINFGIYDNERLVAYASYRTFEKNVVDIGILTHPQYRGKGLGKYATSAITQYALTVGKVPMYRVFSSNPASITIPTALGYKRMLTVDNYKFK